MKWVTWEQVGIDRMGCAWLIRRFVDEQAEFLFVPLGQLSLPAGAEPFDIPGMRLSHHGGHCTFATMLQTYHLADPILQRIARMIDEADTVQEVTLEPAAPGLDLICRGLRQVSPDDNVALERGALLYEALYAQLASEGSPNTTTGARAHGEGEQTSDPPPQLEPHSKRASEAPDLDHDAPARREVEGEASLLDDPTAPSASG